MQPAGSRFTTPDPPFQLFAPARRGSLDLTRPAVSFEMLDQLWRDNQSYYDRVRSDPVERERAVRDSLEALEAIRFRLARHPLVRQYINHLSASEDGRLVRNDRPWHAMAEPLYQAYFIAHLPTDPVMRSAIDDQVLSPMAALSICAPLLVAQPFLWLNTIDRYVLASPDLPRHVISRTILPYPIMFWSREIALLGELNPSPWLPSTDGPITVDNNFILISHHTDGFRVYRDLSNPDLNLMVPVSYSIKYGSTWPDDFPENIRHDVSEVLRALSFLNSKYVATERKPLERHWRKSLTREGFSQQAQSYCNVVTLRSLAQRPGIDQTRQAADGAPTREYHGSWWVRGHHRAQWYPSEQAHHVRWIERYLKGHGPLIPKVYRVAR